MSDNIEVNREELLEDAWTTLQWLKRYLDEQYRSCYEESECERYYVNVIRNVYKYIRPVMQELEEMDKKTSDQSTVRSTLIFPDPYDLANR